MGGKGVFIWDLRITTGGAKIQVETQIVSHWWDESKEVLYGKGREIITLVEKKKNILRVSTN